MSDPKHTVVWIDHREARIFGVGGDNDPEIDVNSRTTLQRLHHGRTGWEAGGNPPDDTEFFMRIIDALENTGGILITGPGNARTALKAFLDHARPESASRVFTIEAPHQADAAALLALGRRYFDSLPASAQSTVQPDQR